MMSQNLFHLRQEYPSQGVSADANRLRAVIAAIARLNDERQALESHLAMKLKQKRVDSVAIECSTEPDLMIIIDVTPEDDSRVSISDIQKVYEDP